MWAGRGTPATPQRNPEDRAVIVDGSRSAGSTSSSTAIRSTGRAAPRRPPHVASGPFRLWLSCHTQQEIADALNIARRTIADMTEEFGEIGQMAESAAR